MFRDDDDDDGVVESRAMIFSLRRSPAVVVVDCSVPTSCAGSGSCFVSTNVELVVAFEVRPCAVFPPSVSPPSSSPLSRLCFLKFVMNLRFPG